MRLGVTATPPRLSLSLVSTVFQAWILVVHQDNLQIIGNRSKVGRPRPTPASVRRKGAKAEAATIPPQLCISSRDRGRKPHPFDFYPTVVKVGWRGVSGKSCCVNNNQPSICNPAYCNRVSIIYPRLQFGHSSSLSEFRKIKWFPWIRVQQFLSSAVHLLEKRILCAPLFCFISSEISF